MGNIPEHHSEEEWESYRSHDWGIDLLIAGNAVSVGDFLSYECIRVGIKSSGWVSKFDLVQSWWRHHLYQALAKQLDLLLGNVQLSANYLFPQLELVQCLIDNLFFPQENPPTFQVPDIFDLMQERLHLFLIQLNIVYHLVVLFL